MTRQDKMNGEDSLEEHNNLEFSVAYYLPGSNSSFETNTQISFPSTRLSPDMGGKGPDIPRP